MGRGNLAASAREVEVAGIEQLVEMPKWLLAVMEIGLFLAGWEGHNALLWWLRRKKIRQVRRMLEDVRDSDTPTSMEEAIWLSAKFPGKIIPYRTAEGVVGTVTTAPDLTSPETV